MRMDIGYADLELAINQGKRERKKRMPLMRRYKKIGQDYLAR